MIADSLIARAVVPRLLDTLRESWTIGRLVVELPDGMRHSFGPESSPSHARIRVKSPAFFRRFLLGGDMGVGESYMDGEWEADDLATFLTLAAENEDRLAVVSPLTKALNLGNDVLHLFRRNTRRGSRKNIGAHYDLSNEFFGLFLDETLTYSSAVFDSEDQPLADAQRNKYRSLAEKARLGPGDHVLEVGCGWGGFALFAAREYGCRVTGITVSERQHSLARTRVAAAGLDNRIEIRLQDYRDVDGTFDKIVSIEMFEALGREHWPVFFAKLEQVLAPRGLVALQTISVPDHRFEDYARHCDWIQRYIFPGSLLASLHHVTGAMSRVSRLGVHHLEDIGPHYALTLARWRQTFLSKLEPVRALGFDDRFVRMWDYYLAACQAYFATRRLGDLQLVLTRPGNASLRAIPARRPVAA
jgi:cyclopropane-fatty-acyl-phospholipid synthase